MGTPRGGAKVPRPAITQARAFRLLVPIAVGALALAAVVILAAAAAVLLGFLPYPGK